MGQTNGMAGMTEVSRPEVQYLVNPTAYRGQEKKSNLVWNMSFHLLDKSNNFISRANKLLLVFWRRSHRGKDMTSAFSFLTKTKQNKTCIVQDSIDDVLAQHLFISAGPSV